MTILYDSQIFRVQKFGGVSRYCAELIHGLENSKEYKAIPGRFFSYNKHLNLLGLTNHNFLRDHLNIPGKKFIERIIKNAEDRSFLKTLRSGSFDIYHPTYYNPVGMDSMPPQKPMVATIHDMTYELYYDTQYNKVHEESIKKKKIIKKASHIVAVSENTKKDILSLYPEIHPEDITVIYHGSSLKPGGSMTGPKLPAKYLLYIGKRGKYKNFIWLLSSLAEYLVKNNCYLVCAGGRRFADNERKLIEELGLVNTVLYFDINTDDELAAMYTKAACFIYPSSHEGFGIPILEAYSCGCPALLAESSCFPEIGADGALYFQNGNKEQLVDQLNKILTDKELVLELRSRGFTRLKDFSWQKTVEQHKLLYKKVLSQ